jgi:cytochrome P450
MIELADRAATDDLAALLRGEPQALAERFPIYDRLRDTAPVVVHEGVVFVSRHEDVRAVLADAGTFSSSRGHAGRLSGSMSKMSPRQQAQIEELSEFLGGWMNENDDPRHAQLREVVQFAFTPRRIAAMRERVQALVDEMLVEPERRGEIELVDELAFPLPLFVVSEMLGIGPERHDDIRTWSDELAVAFDSGYSNLDAAYDAYIAFRDLVAEIIQQRRDGGPTTDLFGALLHTPDDGTGLTDIELSGMLMLLLFAGHETTTNLIGNAILAMLDHPDQLSLLREDPSLTASAVNEFLRYNGSVHSLRRVATRDCEIAGTPVSAGQPIRLMLAAANRDPSVFPAPAELDVRRKNATQHQGLGYGVHRCLGAWLARLETEVVVTTLLTRFPALQLVGEVQLHPTVTVHGPIHLRLQLR